MFNKHYHFSTNQEEDADEELKRDVHPAVSTHIEKLSRKVDTNTQELTVLKDKLENATNLLTKILNHLEPEQEDQNLDISSSDNDQPPRSQQIQTILPLYHISDLSKYNNFETTRYDLIYHNEALTQAFSKNGTNAIIYGRLPPPGLIQGYCDTLIGGGLFIALGVLHAILTPCNNQLTFPITNS